MLQDLLQIGWFNLTFSQCAKLLTFPSDCLMQRISPVAFTTDFAKTVISHPKYPNKVLVCYEGDDSVVVDFPHGNAKHPNKVSRPYHRTKPSLLRAMKAAKGKAPLEAFSDFTIIAPTGSIRSIVDSPRDIKQVRNAKHQARQDERLWKEAVHTLYELYNETDFVSDVHVIPQLIVVCFKKSKQLCLLHLIFKLFIFLQFGF